MHTLFHVFVVVCAVTAVGACGTPPPPSSLDRAATEAIAREAHEAYVTAINSNNLETLLGALTDDVVYQSPHEPEVVGKAAVRQWGDGYLKAFTIHWEKTSLEFVVAGDWAFERYAYKSSDTPRTGGPAVQDTGKGINIYHHEPDGKWRVARDGWSSDLPLPVK